MPNMYLLLMAKPKNLGLDILQAKRLKLVAYGICDAATCSDYFQIDSPRFSHIIPVLKSLQWLKVKERIEYKLLSHL